MIIVPDRASHMAVAYTLRNLIILVFFFFFFFGSNSKILLKLASLVNLQNNWYVFEELIISCHAYATNFVIFRYHFV